MYAIVDIAGQQFKVNKAGKVYVHRLQAEEGSQIELKNVLLIDDEKNVQVGKPNVDGAHVLAQVVEHMKSDKVLVFHKKRRKSYQKMNGHRQYMTQLNILSIVKDGVSLTGEDAPMVEKRIVLPPAKIRRVVTASEPKAEKEVAVKKAAPKKAAAKKPVAEKKPAAKKPAAKKTKKDE